MRNVLHGIMVLLVLVVSLGLPVLVGMVLHEVTESTTFGVVAGLLTYVPFYLVFKAAREEERELEEYYVGLK